MKSVLISIQPKWCDKISNREKTIEVRKSAPKCEVPFKCYIYCTNTPKYHHLYDLREFSNGDFVYSCVQHNKYSLVASGYANGKVIGEFVCDKIDKFNLPYPAYFYEVPQEVKDLIKSACLTMTEAHHYLGQKAGYGWHISDLKIYDKPRELKEFRLKRAPQGWCYVEEAEDDTL